MVKGKQETRGGEPCLHKASALAIRCGEAHTSHQRKLCYKRAFDSGEGMGRGWEWVGLVWGGGGGEGGVLKTLRSVRPYCA